MSGQKPGKCCLHPGQHRRPLIKDRSIPKWTEEDDKCHLCLTSFSCLTLPCKTPPKYWAPPKYYSCQTEHPSGQYLKWKQVLQKTPSRKNSHAVGHQVGYVKSKPPFLAQLEVCVYQYVGVCRQGDARNTRAFILKHYCTIHTCVHKTFCWGWMDIDSISLPIFSRPGKLLPTSNTTNQKF